MGEGWGEGKPAAMQKLKFAPSEKALTLTLSRGRGDRFTANLKKQPVPYLGKCRLLFEWRMACWDGAHGVALPPYPHCTPPTARGAGNRRNRLTDVLPRVSSAPQNAKAACTIYASRNPKPEIQNKVQAAFKPSSKSSLHMISLARCAYSTVFAGS